MPNEAVQRRMRGKESSRRLTVLPDLSLIEPTEKADKRLLVGRFLSETSLDESLSDEGGVLKREKGREVRTRRVEWNGGRENVPMLDFHCEE